MVKRPYVIIVGVEPGVHFANWVEVAPLVKNYPSSIYQCAESEEEAWRLFENARLKGQVRDLSLPPGSTASARRSSNSSASNVQHPKNPSLSKLAISRSEAPVRNGVSPTRSNFRDSNTGSAAGRATTSLNRVITVSRSYSEPNPHMSASNSLKKVYGQRYPASDGTETSSSVDPTSTQIRTRVESPSWLAPYPDDEIEQSISPALSPIASPAISSRSFESRRPVPFSTPSNSRHDGEAVEYTSYNSSELAKSRVPSSRRQEVRGSGRSGASQATESKNAAMRESPKNSRHDEAVLQQQGNIEPFVQLVVDEVLKRLRPSARVEYEFLADSSSERPSRSKRHDRNTEKRSKKSDGSSPSSPSQQSTPSPASGAKDLLSSGLPNGSVLFDHSHDNLGALVRNSPLKRNGLCQHCKGTGWDVGVDTSILEETGLNQPNIAPYDAVQDPRSPFAGLKKLASPLTFRRPSSIVLPKISAKTSF